MMCVNILSFGGGVNSVALMLWLIDHGIDFEAVYINHKCDWPETYEYIDYLKDKGYNITTVDVNVEGFDNLYEYCWNYKILPAIGKRRMCSYKFKYKQFNSYISRKYESNVTVFIGFTYDERRRVKRHKDESGYKYKYPFVDNRITRSGCIRIIREHGLKIPHRSNCFICPIQPKREWIELYTKHPNLFYKAVKLEERVNKHRKKRGLKEIYFRSDRRPLIELSNFSLNDVLPPLKQGGSPLENFCWCQQDAN